MFTIIMVQVQLRLTENLPNAIDTWIKGGKIKSRSDAIRIVLSKYEEREKTRELYKTLHKRSKEAREHPEILIPLE
jgi:Arc/MetJ-type ribon-helix-helix transcriptional regulator